MITKQGWSKVEGYQEALFDEKPIARAALGEERQLLASAFNILGSMGWELATYTSVLLLSQKIVLQADKTTLLFLSDLLSKLSRNTAILECPRLLHFRNRTISLTYYNSYIVKIRTDSVQFLGAVHTGGG